MQLTEEQIATLRASARNIAHSPNTMIPALYRDWAIANTPIITTIGQPFTCAENALPIIYVMSKMYKVQPKAVFNIMVSELHRHRRLAQFFGDDEFTMRDAENTVTRIINLVADLRRGYRERPTYIFN